MKKKNAIITCGLVLGALLANQNCSKVAVSDLGKTAASSLAVPATSPTPGCSSDSSLCPQLSASFSAANPAPGATDPLVTTSTNVVKLSYQCDDGESGNLNLTNSSTNIVANKDMSCVVTGVAADGTSIQQTAQLSLTCSDDQVKDSGACIAYACKQFVPITSFPFTVPARTAAGVCYYKKLFSAIPLSNSTGSMMNNVLARRHPDMGSNGAPYILGQTDVSFTLTGARNVKLSGAGTSLAPILVDNFIVIGSRLASDSDSRTAYTAFGTSDATMVGTKDIQVNGNNVPLTAFASGGTATIQALTISDQFVVGQQGVLEVDALDCGGSRQLSDIYVLFQ